MRAHGWCERFSFVEAARTRSRTIACLSPSSSAGVSAISRRLPPVRVLKTSHCAPQLFHQRSIAHARTHAAVRAPRRPPHQAPGARERQWRVPRLQHEERVADARDGLCKRVREPAGVQQRRLVLAAHEDVCGRRACRLVSAVGARAGSANSPRCSKPIQRYSSSTAVASGAASPRARSAASRSAKAYAQACDTKRVAGAT